MLDNSEKSKAQLAMERLARPLSSYRKTGKIKRAIPDATKTSLDKVVKPKYEDDSLDKEFKNISIKTKM